MPQEITAGGGAGFRLAPDLNYISNKVSNTANQIRISGIDPSAGFTTALNLNGKFLISYMLFGSLSSTGSIDVKLTIDDVLIWDTSTANTVTSLSLIGTQNSIQETIYCDSSLVLEVSKADDSDIYLDYLARPIL